MDSVASPTAPGVWTIEATEGIVLGATEQRPQGFVVVPSVGSQLADFDVPPYASLEAALVGVGAHLQGTCTEGQGSAGQRANAGEPAAFPWPGGRTRA
jgi:hypothetical protein